MPAEVSDQAAELFVELAQITGLSQQDWSDFEQLSSEQKQLTIDGLRAADWAAPGTNTLERVVAIGSALLTVAGIVSGVAGAVSAINALRSL